MNSASAESGIPFTQVSSDIGKIPPASTPVVGEIARGHGAKQSVAAVPDFRQKSHERHDSRFSYGTAVAIPAGGGGGISFGLRELSIKLLIWIRVLAGVRT